MGNFEEKIKFEKRRNKIALAFLEQCKDEKMTVAQTLEILKTTESFLFSFVSLECGLDR